MQSVRNKVLAMIYGHGKGWCFSQKDLLRVAARNDVDKALSMLTREGKIRRIGRGLYDYPRFSKVLNKSASSDVDQAAKAIARKYGWTIHPTGALAANVLGVSTQVPARVTYLSDGPDKSVKIGNTNIRFKHRVPKDLRAQHPKSALVIQTLKHLGKKRVTRATLRRIQAQLSDRDCRRLLKDARYGTDWIYETVQALCAKRGTEGG